MDFTLTNENIGKACEEVEKYLDSNGVEIKEQIRVRMNMEEILLNYQKAFGKDSAFRLDTGGAFGSKKVRIAVPGKKTDPFETPEYSTDEDDVMKSVLTRMGSIPRWRYRRGANEILFISEKRKMPDWMRLLIAIIAAVVIGLIVRMLPDYIGVTLHDGIIGPLIDTFLGFLNAVAGPMVFLSVVWGINSIGDAATFSEVGKHIGIKYGEYLGLMTLAGAMIGIPFFDLKYGSAQGAGDFSSLYQMVLDIIPDNLFTPFSRGNTLQILFVAIIVGVAMLMISKDTQSIADLSEQLGFIVDGIMGVISKLVPAFVFGSLFNIIVSGEYSMLAVGGKFLVSTVIGSVTLLILHTVLASFRLKISPVGLWKKTLSTFIIAITTASSSAAFSDNLNTCVNKLGISKRVANFGVPFGQILYKPGVSILFLYAALSSAESGLTEVSLTWLVTALLVSIVLSAAAPPVPGGMSASFAILFSQLGLSMGNLAIILSLTSILDFLITGVNIFSAQCVLAIAAKKIEKK